MGAPRVSDLRALAHDLVRGQPRFDGLRYESGDARALLAKADSADLVVASYVIGEFANAERNASANLAARMDSCCGCLVRNRSPRRTAFAANEI